MRVKLKQATAFEEPWLLVLAAIGSDRHVDAMAALRYNALTAVGALVVETSAATCARPAACDGKAAKLAALNRTIDFIARQAAKPRHMFAPCADAAGHWAWSKTERAGLAASGQRRDKGWAAAGH